MASTCAAAPAAPAGADADVLLLQVADLFDPQATHAALRRLVRFFNRQALETRQLRDQLHALETQQSERSARVARVLDERLASVDCRLVQLEALAQAQQERERRVELRVARLEAAAREAAIERQELREEEARVERAAGEALEKLRSETASFALVSSLHDDQRLLHERVSTLDRRLDAKMEKTEAARVEALVAKIDAFAPRSEQLTEQLAALRVSQAELTSALAASAEHLRRHELQLSEGDGRANAAALKLGKLERLVCDSALKALADQNERLQHAEDAIGSLAVKASGSEAAQRTLSSKLRSVASALAEQMATQSDAFQFQVDDRARSADVAQQIAQVQREVSARADAGDLQALGGVVERLAAQCASLEEHARLSSRFVDWFASRGAAYEHNLDVVDAQLGRLAAQSQPANRDPFSDQVRYPRR